MIWLAVVGTAILVHLRAFDISFLDESAELCARQRITMYPQPHNTIESCIVRRAPKSKKYLV